MSGVIRLQSIILRCVQSYSWVASFVGDTIRRAIINSSIDECYAHESSCGAPRRCSASSNFQAVQCGIGESTGLWNVHEIIGVLTQWGAKISTLKQAARETGWAVSLCEGDGEGNITVDEA